MKKNKILVLLVVAIGIFTLSGCGNNAGNEKSVSNSKGNISQESTGGEFEIESCKESAIKAVQFYINEDVSESEYEIEEYKEKESNENKAVALKTKNEKGEGYFVLFDSKGVNVECIETMGQTNERGEKKYSKDELKNVAEETFKKVKCFEGKEYEISDNREGTDYRATGFNFSIDGKNVFYVNVGRKTGKVMSLGFSGKEEDKSLI